MRRLAERVLLKEVEVNRSWPNSLSSEDTRDCGIRVLGVSGGQTLYKRKTCASSSASFPGKKIKATHMQAKKYLYESTEDFSEVSETRIASMFGKYEREGIPSNQHIGEEIDAVTWEETLEELVSDLNNKGAALSLQSSQDLLEKCPPALYSPKCKMHKALKVVIEVLEQLAVSNFECNTADHIKEVFMKLSSLLAKRIEERKKKERSSFENIFPIEQLLAYLKTFADLLISVGDREICTTKKTQIHDLLTRFVSQLVVVATLPSTYDDEIDPCMFGSGCAMSFKMRKDGLHLEVDDDDDVMQREEVTFCGKPDILCKRSHRGQNIAIKIAPLVIEIQTTNAGDPCKLTSTSASCHLSGQEQLSMQKRSDPITTKYNSRLENLPKQHFLEMIASLKHFNRMFKIFGMYVVMNRVYFTCMVIVDKEGCIPEDKSLVMKFANISDAEKLDEVIGDDTQQKLHYKQICSKWLNFLNPTHMLAILSFIRFIMLYEYKHMAVNILPIADSE